MASGTKDDPWALTTAPGTSAYSMYIDDEELVCQVGATQLRSTARAIEDLAEWLATQGGWVEPSVPQMKRSLRSMARSRRGAGR